MVAQGVNKIRVMLPTLHDDQSRVFLNQGQHNAVRAGRRWGKTELALTIACDGAIKGEPIGWFAPDYKITRPSFQRVEEILQPVKSNSNKTDGVINTIFGGSVEVWTLENERAGRSRKYKKVIIDEAAFTDNKRMWEIWEQAIKPTLLDYGGQSWVFSNTNGSNSDNFFWKICNEDHGFTQHHAPTRSNPNMPLRIPGEDEIKYQLRRQEVFEKLKSDTPPLVYQQEYEAEFIDWSGSAFFARDNLLVNGLGLPFPNKIDAIFVVIDSATKTGKEHDGTATAYWGYSRFQPHKLVLLDWDVAQIEGALLEAWMPMVFGRLEELARLTSARSNLGAYIEDKASGMILLQQCIRNDWPAIGIDSKLTALGKSERAINVSGYVYRGEVKMSQYAYEKVVVYKGVSRNHMLYQVTGFRVGDREMDEDDLLDTFTYGISLALGNEDGF